MLANLSGAPSALFLTLNDGNLSFSNRWHHLKGVQINLPAWAVSALDPKFVGLLMDGTDEIAISPKMPRGPSERLGPTASFAIADWVVKSGRWFSKNLVVVGS